MTKTWTMAIAGAVCGVLGFAATAQSADKVRIIDSQRMAWAHMAIHNAEAEGYFKKANLDPVITFGTGGADTLQAIVTGSADIAFGVGVLSVVGALAKGAPVTIVANSMKGPSDIFFYVPKSSPVQTCRRAVRCRLSRISTARNWSIRGQARRPIWWCSRSRASSRSIRSSSRSAAWRLPAPR
ncbi:MAG: hypothetical protein GEU91_04190 [Rhizobiales bacterium]|nr:hypothetical protein [Hyphomicrobiales bacterium]